MTTADDLFLALGGKFSPRRGFPLIATPCHRTPGDTRYLTEPGVVMIGRTFSDLSGTRDFLEGFGEEHDFVRYLDDPTTLDEGEGLVKFAGQLCYMSLGAKRTLNADADRYFNQSIKAQKHGSVVEAANYTLLMYGLSRSMTHELVRHRLASYCLAGDTHVWVQDGGGASAVRTIKLADLYAMSRNPTQRAAYEALRLRSMDADGAVHPGRIQAVVCSGEQALIELTTRSGRRLRATSRHRVATEQGWRVVADVGVGDALLASAPAVDGRSARVTPDAIVAMRPCGRHQTYDVEMVGPHHNFVADGLVVHNSQVSQRYVGGDALRFVMRPEYQAAPELAARWMAKVDADRAYYEESCDRLLALQERGYALLDAEKKTEARKRVRQCARESLPNCTEAPIVVTMNVRSWRHLLDMRAATPAEVEIRRLALKSFLCLSQVDALFWNDFALQQLPDGTHVADAAYKKI